MFFISIDKWVNQLIIYEVSSSTFDDILIEHF